MATDNPLLAPSTLPYRLPGTPSATRPEHSLPAFEDAFAAHRQEIDAVTPVRSMPTFENTMVALETAGRSLTEACRALLHGVVRPTPPRRSSRSRRPSPR